MPESFDCAIVGGGPAGLGLAIAARLAGLTVVVIERRHPPLDKACGEGLMPGGLAVLDRLGVALDPGTGWPLSGIRYLDADSAGRSIVAEGSFPSGPGLGLRRTALHAALVRRAVRLGARLRWGTRALALLPEGVETDAGAVRAGWIVGADGLHSAVRRWAGLACPGGARRFGVRRHFELAPWSDRVEVHWAEKLEAYVTPVGERQVGVALLTSADRPEFDALLARFPVLAMRLAGRRVTSETRGGGPFHQRVRAVHAGRLALVGDAAGFVDPITGEGVSLALRQAEALARALDRGDLRAYARAHRRIVSGYRRVTLLLLAVQRRPGLRRRTIRALARCPDVFTRLLGVPDGASPLAAVGLAGAARLSWGAIRG